MSQERISHSNGFTLIELLIVIAILGILTAIAIPQFRGYAAQGKIGAVNGNHKNILTLLSSEFAKCTAGATQSIMGTVVTDCSETVDVFADAVKSYLDAEHVQNPYNAIEKAIIVGAAGADEGYTYLTADVATGVITVTSIISPGNSIIGTVSKE